MWIVIGVVLLIYAIVVLVILYRWWQAVLDFVRDFLINSDAVIVEAEGLTAPLQSIAQDARQSAGAIDGVGDEIERVVPPALTSIASAMSDLNTSIHTFHTDANTQLDSIAGSARDALQGLADLLRDQGTITFPALTAILRDVGGELDQLEYRVGADVLAHLQNDLGVPAGVVDKLRDLVDHQFPDRDTMDNAVKARLADEEYQAHHDTIADAAKNPDVDADIVGLLRTTADAILHVGKDTLPDTAKSLEHLATTYVALVTVLVGPATPLALIVIAAANALLLLKNVISAINIKVNKGDWLSAHVVLPPVDLKIPVTTVPAGLISYDKSWHVAGQRIGFSFSLPGNDFHADLDIASRGAWYDHQWYVPPSDIELFNGHGLVDAIEDVRTHAEAIRDAVIDAPETANGLRAAAAKMKESGAKLEKLGSEALPKQADRLVQTAVTLRDSADKLDQVAALLVQRSATLTQQAGDLLSRIGTFKGQLLATLDSASQSVTTATQALQRIDLAPTVSHLHEGASSLRDAANRVDDGSPIGTAGKADIVQRFFNVLERVRKLIPSMKKAESIINPVFYILAALHVGILLVALWLIFRGTT